MTDHYDVIVAGPGPDGRTLTFVLASAEQPTAAVSI